LIPDGQSGFDEPGRAQAVTPARAHAVPTTGAKSPVDRIDPNVRSQERSRRPQGMAVRQELASKRPTPADCSNRADLAAAVEEFHKAQSGRIEPAKTSHSPTA
jgi:hypothetical protein